LATEVIGALPRTGDVVFSAAGAAPVSGFSRAKGRLDGLMAVLLREESGNPEAAISGWRLHDLRRTAATGMARLKFAPHVVDKVLNHVAGAIRGVAAVYNRFEYLDDRKVALEAWGRYVENLVRPGGDNVVEFGKRA
jgi:hypothetical protein